MRNLKRALSLVLAAAMLIGMMVLGASAAEYKDDDSITYTDAVDILTALGGGGHADAAGAVTALPPEQIEAIVLEDLGRAGL